MKLITIPAVCGLALAVSLVILATAQPPKESRQLREQATQLRQQGNVKEALTILRKLLTDPDVPGAQAAQDLNAAVECLQQLGQYDQLDELLSDTLAKRKADWRVLAAAAKHVAYAPHHGIVADQKFRRAPQFRDASGRHIDVGEQDRQQALIWLVEALQLLGELPQEEEAPAAGNAALRPADSAEASAAERAQVWSQLASVLLISREHRWGWRLQSKTPLDEPPDYLDFEAPTGFPMRYASVDEEGQPIFWKVPESWADADSDAERLRWALKQIEATEDQRSIGEAQLAWAGFLHSQFSVDTLADRPRILRSRAGEEREDDGEIEDEQSGIMAVHTLEENETIAKLASGIRRFELPDDLNPIRIYQRIADGEGTTSEAAHTQLVSTFMNRRQYSKAAKILQQSIERFGDPEGYKQRELDNIIKPRGSFDPVTGQPAGQGAKLGFVFRNAESADFSAQRVDLEKLLSAIKTFYRNPASAQQPAFGDRKGVVPPDIDQLQELFNEQQLTKYVGEPVATWSLQLEPRENHWDRRITVTTPLEKAGLYVVTASLDDGAHLARSLVWINDLAIVRKPMSEKQLIYVADALTGQPVGGANVEFFGVEQAHNNQPRFVAENFARKTDAEGQIVLPSQKNSSKQWLIVARDPRGRFSISGSQSFWSPRMERESYSQVKAYGVADQPVHRPGGKLRAQFWIGRASYAADLATAPLGHSQFLVQLKDPHGKVFWEKTKTTDEIGACEVEIDLPDTATLGVYSFHITAQGQSIATNLRVRVEEFRKPEFEIKIDAPEKPVELGEKIEAKVSARYYFGSPVTNAYVNVKVTRSAYVDQWYPVRAFDWCYGPGYWWFAYDYDWYPGWNRWVGCMMPSQSWWPRSRFEPPELVLEQELTLDDEGAATLTIDTAMAAELYGDQDHRYAIEVEVRDASRRTLTASGAVIASRQPFKIYSWLHRGYYEVGQTVEASFLAQTLDRRPVAAAGKLELLRITYDADRKPLEAIVETWDAQTDENGSFQQRFVARRGGQYRLRLRLKDESGQEVEGGYVFTVRGDQVAPDNFRFSQLELIPDKPEYAPGERVQLQINADRADAMVLLFVRSQNGIAPPPRMVKLSGKSAKIEIAVSVDDQPNFFVEAFTIYDGKFYSATREIFVPPASRVLDVAVEANKSEYLPGEKGEVAIAVKDAAGMPVSGSVLVAIYDRALEAIAPDTLAGDIREFFWKWRRRHRPTNWENLSRVTYPVAIDDIPAMTPLGIFGQSVDETMWFNPMMRQPMARGRIHLYDADGSFGSARGMPMKAMAAAPAAGLEMAMAAHGAGAGGPAEQASTAVRKDFADSALWLTELKCDENGRARANFTMPENLTDWQIRSWAMGPGLRVGSGTSSAVTRKNILVRLATPRFLVERDEVVLSAIVHNDFDSAQDVRVRLEIDGETQLQLSDDAQAERTVHIAAHDQVRVDWPCRALAEGEVTLRAFAESPDQSDAMQLKLPIIVNGILKTDSWAGTVRADEARGSMKITVPEQRRIEHSRLTVRLSPSLALAMVDALPYLVEYPYECTEQTLNRFLPTVMTQRMLIEMKVDLESVKQHRNNLNAQELGDARERAEGWKRFDRNPVFDRDVVDKMVEAGVQRLTDQQNSDGGWGWFSNPYEVSGAHTTATVVRGLLVAQQNGVAIVPDVLERGLAWLEQYQNAELQKLQNAASKTEPYKESVSNVDALVFHTLVLGQRPNEAMQRFLYDKRADLSVYGKALLAWATHTLANQEQTSMLRRNIEQFLVEDAENETAYLRDQSPWWYWWGSEIEANAIYLKLLAAQDPQGRVAPRLVKYLLNNRKHATYWNSTRDTALVVEAFADYLRASGETKSTVSGEVLLAGKRLGSVHFTPETMFTAETTLQIAGNAVPSGEQTLEIRRSGSGPLYYSAYLSNFTLEEEIAASGLEVKLQRRYYRLDRVRKSLELAGGRGQVIDTERAAYDRVAVDDLAALPSGTLVEVELLIESKNDYEYLMIEERKAAGLEPVDIQSGYQYADGLGVYREMRDKHVAFFLRTLPRGQHSLRYQLRTEAPGQFTALPAVISGMYAPELAGNSEDKDLRVE